MGQFSIPAEAAKFSAVVDTFRGVDLNNSPANVDPSRSPAAPNMIRDQVGKVRKRMGYTTVATAPNGGRINGVHHLGDKTLIHAGDRLYRWDGKDGFTEVGAMADARSRGFVFARKKRADEKDDDETPFVRKQRLYLLDGTTYQVYDGETLKPVSEDAYVPTVIIGRSTSGGGTAYEGLNLLGKRWRESFYVSPEATVADLRLTANNLDESETVVVEVLQSSGAWWPIEEHLYEVDRAVGKVTLYGATIATLVHGTGVDNVRITAGKTREGYAEKINSCTVFAAYGVGGSADRIFLSGNKELPGQDFYSGFEDPAYFPDTGYNNLSWDGSEVIGYAVLNNALAALLRGSTDGRNVVVRTGSLDEKGEAVFRITNTLLGEAPVAPHSFVLSGREPLFLTDKGVYAITSEELTGEKYSQERSYYIRSAIQAAEGREDACAVLYRDFYVLALDGTLYLLDMQQKAYERNNPYSSYQYEGFYWPDIHARVLWVEGEALCFGTEDGKLKRFAVNVDDPQSYNDDGNAIDAYWETSDFDGKAFFRSKTFTGISCRLAAAVFTGVKIFAQKRGIWSQVFDAKERARYFSWDYIDFAKFVFSTDATPRTLTGKVKIKKVDKVRFRLQNSEVNEPFGLYAFGVEWRESGSNYKR